MSSKSYLFFHPRKNARRSLREKSCLHSFVQSGNKKLHQVTGHCQERHTTFLLVLHTLIKLADQQQTTHSYYSTCTQTRLKLLLVTNGCDITSECVKLHHKRIGSSQKVHSQLDLDCKWLTRFIVKVHDYLAYYIFQFSSVPSYYFHNTMYIK